MIFDQITTGEDIRRIRDEFAMAALTGMLARPNSSPMGRSKTPENYSAAAYEIADAMLRAREAK